MSRRNLALAAGIIAVAVLAGATSLGTLVVASPWSQTWFMAALGGVLVFTAAFVALVVAWPRAMARVTANYDPIYDWRAMFAFTGVGFAASVWWVLARFGGEELAFDPTTTLANARRVAGLLGEVEPLIRDEIAPIESSAPIAALLVIGVLAVALIADLSLIANTPALAAIPVLALWLPTLAFAQSVPTRAFVATCAALLALLALTASAVRPPHDLAASQRNSTVVRSHARRLQVHSRQVASAATAGVLVLALAGAGRAASPGDGSPVRWFEPTSLDYSGGAFSGEIDISRDLGNLSTREIFRYAASDGRGAGPFSLRTLAHFDGQAWTAADTYSTDIISAALIKSPNDRLPEGYQIVKLGFADPEMPLIPVPESSWATRVTGPWQYNQATSSLQNLGTVPTIEFLVAPDRWTAESLRTAEANQVASILNWAPNADPAAAVEAARIAATRAQRDNGTEHRWEPVTLADGTTVHFECVNANGVCGVATDPTTGAVISVQTGVDPAYLEIPPTEHAESIRGQAQQIVGDADTTYDQALRLQEWLRDPANFTYELRAPDAETGDLVYDFLTGRSGYCVHFATAMAMMARHLGIPARVVSGFLPGEAGEDGQFIVTARQAHMWPELQLPGADWVRFEPTPGSVSGAPPVHAISLAYVPSPEDEGLIPQSWGDPANPWLPASASYTGPDLAATDAAASGPTFTETLPQRAAIASAAGVLTGVGAYATVLVARRRRVLDPEGAWAEARLLLRRLEIDLPVAATPRQAAALVSDQWHAQHQTPFPIAARRGLGELARAIETHRYLPDHLRGPAATAANAQLRSHLDHLRALKAPRRNPLTALRRRAGQAELPLRPARA